MKTLFIGGGAMATALISGLINSGQSPSQHQVVDPDGDQRARLAARFPKAQTHSSLHDGVFAGVEAVVLAVKPQQLQVVARQLAPYLKQHSVPMVLSIAAGVRLKDLSRWLGDYPYVIRAMPNTPALVGAGITGLFASAAANETARKHAHELMVSVGEVFWVQTEEKIDLMTALTGGGPAYVFYFLESLQKAAQSLGLTEKEGRFVALDIVSGGLKLAQQSEASFRELYGNVTSKGGTTERALRVLDEAETHKVFTEAIHAAWRRAIEMGDELGRDQSD